MIKISRAEIASLSAIVGKCAIKSLGKDLFFPMIKLKAAATANVEESQRLLKALYEEVGLGQDSEKIPSQEETKMVISGERSLNEELVEFTDTAILKEDQFFLLSEDNPKLTASELEFLYKWLVKE